MNMHDTKTTSNRTENQLIKTKFRIMTQIKSLKKHVTAKQKTHGGSLSQKKKTKK